jgi:hypothetical protein
VPVPPEWREPSDLTEPCRLIGAIAPPGRHRLAADERVNFVAVPRG